MEVCDRTGYEILVKFTVKTYSSSYIDVVVFANGLYNNCQDYEKSQPITNYRWFEGQWRICPTDDNVVEVKLLGEDSFRKHGVNLEFAEHILMATAERKYLLDQ